MRKVYLGLVKSSMFFVSFLALFSCKRTDDDAKPATSTTLSDTDLEQYWLQQTSHILIGVYRDSLSLMEVNAAIASEFYQDETVMFKDLLHPENSELYKNDKFKQLFPHEPRFGKRFRQVLANGEYPFSDQYNTVQPTPNAKARISSPAVAAPPPVDPDWLIINGASVYYPYSENFVNTTKKITTVTAPANQDAPSATGYRDVYTQICPTRYKTDCYNGWESQPFLVNDDYAWLWPTQIIKLIKEIQRQISIYNDPNLPGNRLVKVGWVKCEEQLDALWNGGSDIYFIRAAAYADPTNAASGRSFEAGQTIKRKDIRNKNWVSFNYIWDPNWVSDRTEQAILVYESDNTSTQKFSVQPKVKINGVEFTLFNYEITFATKEPILYVQTIRYVDFWALNKLDTGNGFREGWAIYKGSRNTYFTLPVQIY